MKKVKLIIGTVNSCSVSAGEKKLEDLYEKSYKPFLRIVHASRLPVTMYYSGELMSWVFDKHDGMQMLVNDIVKKRRIEFLGGGYYSPLFSLIPRKDRVGQIEMMTTDIRKRFGRRPRGIWITEKVWEPSMPMTMNNAGMEFSFIDEEFFEDAGLFNGELYRPCVTEDQGKKVVLFPISNRMISSFMLEEPAEILEQIIGCGSEKEDRVISLLIPGEELDFTADAGHRIEEFFRLLEENRKYVDVVLPGKTVRELGSMKKVYFGCVSPGDIGRWSGPVFREQTTVNGNDISDKNPVPPSVNSQSFFRHFLAKYPESNNLYSRMIEIHKTISQMRGDRQRKKSAELELYKSQDHSAFWHGGGSSGIYSSEARQKAYASLIEAEKFTRERTGFRSSLQKDDFDMDGLDEFIYKGVSLNVNIHLKGGSVFELDYFRTPHNYLATMARHKEWYHDDEVADRYTRNTFIDHFFQLDEQRENIIDMSYREGGDFISGLYEVARYNKERKEVELIRNGSIITRKSKFQVQLKKKYSFKRNIIVVDYEIINNSDAVLNTAFGSEINLAMGDLRGRSVNAAIVRDNKKVDLYGNMISETDVSEFHIKDNRRKVNILLTADIVMTIWGFPVKTKTGTGKVVEELYQEDCYIPMWKISLGPGKVWKNSLQMRIDRRPRNAE